MSLIVFDIWSIFGMTFTGLLPRVMKESYLKTNNPFYLLDIDNLSSTIYSAALDNINFNQLAQKLYEYYGNLPNDELSF